MRTSHIKILETKLLWALWWHHSSTVKPTRVYSHSEVEAYLRPLVRGELVVVEQEFCDLLLHAKDTVPDQLEFEDSWMLGENGFIWFERPFTLPGIRAGESKHLLLRAVGWIKAVDGWQFATYIEHTTNPRTFFAWSWFGVRQGTVLIDKVHSYEEGAGQWDDSAPYDGDSRFVELNHEIRIVFTALHLMSQKVARQVQDRTSNLVRNMLERKLNASITTNMDLRVITLRHQAVEGHETVRREVDWQCRWFVKGHWRNQPYKSTGLVKSIFIAAYVKGPEDKPLQVRDTIYVARR